MSHPFNFARIAAESLHNGDGTVITDGPSDAIATVHRYRGESSHDRAVALFTAAPAMLEALRTLQEHAAKMAADSEMYSGWFAMAAGIAAGAIAAAEGRK